MQCKRCKTDVLNGSTYCPNCGKRLKSGIIPILFVLALLIVFVCTYLWSNYSIVKELLSDTKKEVTVQENYSQDNNEKVNENSTENSNDKSKNKLENTQENKSSKESQNQDKAQNKNQNKVVSNNIVSKGTTSTYKNKEYGFTMNIPKAWKGTCIDIEGNWSSITEKTIDFAYISNDGVDYGNIFTIAVLKEGYTKDSLDPDEGFEYIKDIKGKTIVYMLSSEATSKASDDPAVLEEIRKMINEVPSIINTIKEI